LSNYNIFWFCYWGYEVLVIACLILIVTFIPLCYLKWNTVPLKFQKYLFGPHNTRIRGKFYRSNIIYTASQLHKSKVISRSCRFLSQQDLFYLYGNWSRIIMFARFHTYVLDEMNAVQIPVPYFFTISFNSIIPSSPSSPKWQLIIRISD
jgi:hypothetical protein